MTRQGGEVVVDPMTAGRYQGPFQPGDQDVLIYLRDDLAVSPLHCEASALRASAVVSAGAADVTVVRGEMREVEIFMADPSGGGGGRAAALVGRMAGRAIAAGGPGGGAGDSTGGWARPGGPGPNRGTPNGEACSLDAECVTGHCAGRRLLRIGLQDGVPFLRAGG